MTFEKPGSDLEPNGGGSLLAGRPTIRGLLSCAAVLDRLGHTDGGVKIGLALGKYPLPHRYLSGKMQCRVAAVFCRPVRRDHLQARMLDLVRGWPSAGVRGDEMFTCTE